MKPKQKYFSCFHLILIDERKIFKDVQFVFKMCIRDSHVANVFIKGKLSWTSRQRDTEKEAIRILGIKINLSGNDIIKQSKLYT